MYFSERGSEDLESETVTGCFSEAVVDGFRSWEGEGVRLIEAVWMVSATWRGMEEDMVGCEGWTGLSL